MDARRVRYMETPAEVHGYHAMVWRNAAYFLLTSLGLVVVSAPSFARAEVLSQYLLWIVAASVAVAPLVDIAALAFGVASVRALQARGAMLELLAISPVSTAQVFASRLEAAWLRTWRLLVVLVAVRGVLAALGLLYIATYMQDRLDGWLLALAPAVWVYIWGPMRRARTMTSLAVRVALVHRNNWRVILALLEGAASYTLLLWLVVGLCAYAFALASGLLTDTVAWARYLTLWAFPFVWNAIHTRMHTNDVRDAEIRSQWDDVD